MKRAVATGLLALAAGGCAAKRLPPGTPPPEYETRAIPAWPPASAAPAASAASVPSAATVDGPPSASGPSAAAASAKTPPSPSPSAAGE
ncbi:MAG TPA: hypothetical protein VMI54_07510 [Polyangiaceae bacterium]|nr:hypothetical protein [Polyangiaceae bacterium]